MSPGPIVGLRCANLAQLQSLLGAYDLPFEDCAEQLQIFRGVFDADKLIAAGGLEPAGDEYALLRSIVVHEHYRGQGLARSIGEQLMRQAEAEDRRAIFLLTENAEAYFAGLGFEKVRRDAVPAEIRRTRQFSCLCPDSATCMCIVLPLPGPG